MDIQPILNGDRLALSRVLTQIEKDSTAGRDALNHLFPHTGKAQLIGVTGAPGTGKSSLVNQIAYHYRHPVDDSQPQRIAIVAVDPTSPFTGGAVLGDRIRMRDLSGDPDVFIRSMASRGSLGGLARATAGIVQAYDAAGYDIILIETVGAGQAEVDIARLAHTTLVVEAPGLGDDIQAIKAGILEIADILVVNKADRPGVENTERALRNMLQLAHPAKRVFRHHGQQMEVDGADEQEYEALWIAPIQRTIATDGEGLTELLEHISQHRQHLENTGELARRERARLAAQLDELIESQLVSDWRASLKNGVYEHALDELEARHLSPYEAVQELVKEQKK
ncbi:MAG: methylmalonyl Co-A mutase-associated GTPase MeaB [Chloroflexi bacterium]|nr:MAG: methylmalonyl Co-A mutase-associated GTPase MeaB [Chloroflexota bacterium]MBL1195290.1 methylmalonyl Co-A mutase-associated GTPase MeaB [Chloroflexota bacterium]NOH12574.1 methylmalonyl Co-A mutase-associated GTPase MeaB [Chloroflexota bacterium]